MRQNKCDHLTILAVADEESKYFWDFYEPGKLEGIDLIISCGDLSAHYLDFLETFSNVPLLYVSGNHDTRYVKNPPQGCICIDDRIYVHNGIRILGLGGSMRYSSGEFQYTEAEMRKRVRKIWWQIFLYGGFDILVTHAPAFGLHDGRDLPHQGFKVFLQLMNKYRPKYFLHGHVHMSYGREHIRYDQFEDTHVINAYERVIFDFEAEDPKNNLRMNQEEVLFKNGIEADL